MSYSFEEYPFKAKTYKARIPELSNGSEPDRKKAVIVGGGPVGLCLALGLSNHGIPSVLIEADDSVCFGSRAICLSRRTQEIFERLGALQSFTAKGLPWSGGRSYYRDTEVLHFTMQHDENQKLPPMLNIEQFYIEQYLLDAVEARPDLIEVRWATRATQLQSQEDGVRVTVSTDKGDYSLETDWLLAADGARSSVREFMGLELKGATAMRGATSSSMLRWKRTYQRNAWLGSIPPPILDRASLCTVNPMEFGALTTNSVSMFCRRRRRWTSEARLPPPSEDVWLL